MDIDPAVSAPPRGPDRDDPISVSTLQEALDPEFEVKQRLGRGSMATVFLARERTLGRLVAIKVLLPGRAADETARRRFEREAKAAASLVHPNVVQVFRFGRLPDETPYLVMRYVKGRTMEERLAADGFLPAARARAVLRDVASALAAAHAQGIVHRDVRPANVLWDEEGDAALLADFGIAALLAAGGEEGTRLTKTGQVMGDPRYLSPEQLLDRDLTELADMYAFGVLGYQLLTGEGPYDARSNTEWITAHLNGTPRDLRSTRPDVDPSLADLLRRCLNREPNHRPSAASAAGLLGGSGAPIDAGRSGMGSSDVTDLGVLLKRRVPQIVAVAGAAALGFLGFMDMLVDRGTLGQLWWDLSLPLAGCGVAASTVVAWFHGERGKQQTSVFEWMLLAAVAAVWIVISASIIVGG